MSHLFRRVILGFAFFSLFSFISEPAFCVNAVSQEGYQANAISASVGGGFDFLPNGDILGLSTENFSTLHLVLIDGNGDNQPPSPQVLATFPPEIAWGTFLKISPSGTTAILAESSTNKIFRYDIQNNQLTYLMTLPGIFEGVFINEQTMYLSTGSFSGDADAWYWNWPNVSAPPVLVMTVDTGDAAAAAIATDDAGSLYYLKTSNSFTPPPNSNSLYQFTFEQISNVINGSEPPLHPSDGNLIAQMNSGFGLQVNAFGQIFVSMTGFDGGALGIIEVKRDGTIVPFLTFDGLQGFEFTSVLAMMNRHSFFKPYEASDSQVAILFDDFSNPTIYAVATSQSDPFADDVIAHQLSNPQNANLVLGPPIGGGTFDPNNSSLVSLTDGTGFVTVSLNGGVKDARRSLHGSDLLVFGNAFFIGGNPLEHFTEPGFVEVKSDLNHNGNLNDDPWFLLEPSILPENLSPPYQTLPLRGYADYNPTLILGDTNADNIVDNPNMIPEDFYTIPDFPSFAGNNQSFDIDAGSGGGDAFDLRTALFETSPGIPLRDAEGNVRRVYLDQIHQIRIHDAHTGDGVMADIDAIAAAKDHIVGSTITVETASQLQAAVANASEGDVIRILPGVYAVSTPIFLRPGVSLEGPSGYKSVNYAGDDAIIQGAQLPAGQAAIVVSGDEPLLNQDFSISGLHFRNCPIGIQANGHRPLINENFFINCRTSIRVSNASQTVVIRNNVIGHRNRLGGAFAQKGVEAINAHVALIHNTIVNHMVAGLSYGSESNVYLRDNIFFKNGTGVREESASELFGHFNNFYSNNTNTAGQGTFENNVLQNPLFASAYAGDYRLKEQSLVRNQGLGGSHPGAYNDDCFIPYDVRSELIASVAGERVPLP